MTKPQQKKEVLEDGDGNTGKNLLKTVVELTGLPEDLVQQDLGRILAQAGLKAEDNLTLDQLRGVMLAYLDAIHFDVQQNISGKVLQ